MPGSDLLAALATVQTDNRAMDDHINRSAAAHADAVQGGDRSYRTDAGHGDPYAAQVDDHMNRRSARANADAAAAGPAPDRSYRADESLGDPYARSYRADAGLGDPYALRLRETLSPNEEQRHVQEVLLRIRAKLLAERDGAAAVHAQLAEREGQLRELAAEGERAQGELRVLRERDGAAARKLDADAASLQLQRVALTAERAQLDDDRAMMLRGQAAVRGSRPVGVQTEGDGLLAKAEEEARFWKTYVQRLVSDDDGDLSAMPVVDDHASCADTQRPVRSPLHLDGYQSPEFQRAGGSPAPSEILLQQYTSLLNAATPAAAPPMQRSCAGPPTVAAIDASLASYRREVQGSMLLESLSVPAPAAPTDERQEERRRRLDNLARISSTIETSQEDARNAPEWVRRRL